jgi:choline kinase
MLPLGGTTMMALILDNLKANGVDELLVVTGFKSEALKEHILEHCGTISVFFSHNADYASTNNAYSLYLAREFAEGRGFFLLDSDIVFEAETLGRVARSENENALAIRKTGSIGEEEMKVFTDDSGEITAINKTGSPESALGESVGIEKFSGNFSSALFATLERRIKEGSGLTEYYEASFQELLDKGNKIYPVDVSDTLVMEVDFPEDFKKAESELLPLIHEKQKGRQ